MQKYDKDRQVTDVNIIRAMRFSVLNNVRINKSYRRVGKEDDVRTPSMGQN